MALTETAAEPVNRAPVPLPGRAHLAAERGPDWKGSKGLEAMGSGPTPPFKAVA